MKDYLTTLVQAAPSPSTARYRVREYLQVRLLHLLQQQGAMIPLAFQGGTALRLLYGIQRFSEDLDFALERRPEDFNLPGYLEAIQRRLNAEGYKVVVRRVRTDRVVHSAFVAFPGLLHELGLSPHPDESLSIKIEVDTRPPVGAGLRTTLLQRHHLLLHLQHHDRATLLAGKVHALLQRPYLKGRDVYDLAWMLSTPDWPEPNFSFLKQALAQTGWRGPELSAENWRQQVWQRLQKTSWEAIRRDVQPFLEDPSHVAYLSPEVLRPLLLPERPGT